MNRDLVLVALVQNHHSFYAQLIRLLATTGKTVTLLTIRSNENLVTSLDKNLFDVRYEEGNISDVLLKNKHLIDQHKVLIIDELYDGFSNTWCLNFKNQTKICFIHNANKWFYSKPARGLKAHLKNYIKNKYIEQFDSYVVMGPNVVDYMQSVGVDKPVFVLPFDQGSIDDDTSDKDNSIVITIPGMIAQNRRDYLGLIRVLNLYYKKHTNSRIRICLLGRIVGEHAKQLKEAIDSINEEFGPRVKYWVEFIPDDEFERQLAKSHLFMSNLKVIISSDISNEIYGITKETGIAYAIAKYAKPAIVPYLHQVLFGLDSQLLKYLDYESLMSVFEDLDLGKTDLTALKANAISNREYVNGKLDELKVQLSDYLLEHL